MITVEKPTPDQVAEFRSLPTWDKAVSTFPWTYDIRERAYVLEGEVEVTTDDGQSVAFGAGDLVTFPRGTSCTWRVKKPFRKHYRYG